MNRKKTNQERRDEPAGGLATDRFSRRRQGQRRGDTVLGWWPLRAVVPDVPAFNGRTRTMTDSGSRSRDLSENRYYLGTKIKSRLRGTLYSGPYR